MAVTLRQTATDTGAKATALTHQEMNNNFKDFLTFTTATTSAGPYTISSVFAPILSATNGVRATGPFAANQISTGGMDYYATTNGARFLSWGPAGVTGTFTWWSGQGNSGTTEKMRLEGIVLTVDGKRVWHDGNQAKLLKTSAYTAADSEHIFANTSGGAFTLTLPASPAEGDFIRITDYANTFNTGNLTVARNGSTIEGAATDAVLTATDTEYLFTYLNSTWKIYSTTLKANVTSSTSIQGPSSGNEGTVVTLVIVGWVTGATYAVSTTGGSTSVVTNSIYWTLPSVSSDTLHTLTLTVNGTTQYTKTINVLNVSTVTDTSISVTNFAVNNSNTGWTV